MAEGLCTISITGRLGADPELKTTDKGAVLKLRVAVNQGWGDKERTEWFGCALWGKRAEALARLLKKGDAVGIVGRFSSREWEKDGAKRTALEVAVDSLALLGGKPDGQGARPTPKPAARGELPVDDFGGGDGADDIPF